MAITNHERVGKAMELLKAGLGPFVEREFKNTFKDRAAAEALRYQGDDRINAKKTVAEWDAAAHLKLMWESWNEVFRQTLGPSERSLVSELRDHRNKWAHQAAFSGDDAYRALDSAGRLLTAVSAPQADKIERMKAELLRIRFDEQARSEKRKSAGSAIEGAAAGGLKPWREVVTPHKDVASGRYQQAEFAADLWQVHLGQGTDEYKNPVEFFRRTYLTESLTRMLVGAVQRLAGQGGDPVVQLQTNFGGGKTHSMLALYHLFSGIAPSELSGIDAVMNSAGSPHTQADDVEVGGQRGREALDRLRNVVGRVESPWRPASAEEGFENVRRRLFEPMTNPSQYKDRDVVAIAFADLYRTQHREFPPECRDSDYEKRIKGAYPIHPDV
jgi:hypothetical protein